MRTAEGDLWHRIVETGCQAYVEIICSSPGEQRIIFVDGPAVLGPRLWHDNEPGLMTIKHGLEQLAEAGLIAKQPFGPLAHLFFGAFLEAGLCIVYSSDPSIT